MVHQDLRTCFKGTVRVSQYNETIIFVFISSYDEHLLRTYSVPGTEDWKGKWCKEPCLHPSKRSRRHGSYPRWAFFFFFKIFVFSIIIDLQRPVNFCCTAEWPSHTYTFFSSHYPPDKLLIRRRHVSLHYWISIRYTYDTVLILKYTLCSNWL